MQQNTSFNLRQLLHVCAVAIVSATAAILLTGQRAIPQEQYIVINVVFGESPTAFQAQLNELGSQGWRVRTTVGQWIILAAER